MKLQNLSVLTDSKNNTLGETPVYCNWIHKLIWVDILKNEFFVLDPENFEYQTLSTDFLVSAILPTTEKGIFLLISDTGIYTYDLIHTKVIRKLADFPEKNTRPNEAQVTPEGNVLFGTMAFDASYKKGAWYIFSAKDHSVELLESEISIPNTLVFLEESILFGDTTENTIFKIPRNFTDWQKEKQAFISFDEGGADGSYLSADQLLITARWGHSKLTVHLLGKQPLFIANIDLPVKQPSSCIIVPTNKGNRLFITSANTGLTAPSDNDGKLCTALINAPASPVNRFKL